MTVVSSIYGHDISGPTANRPTNLEPGMIFMDTTVNVLYAQTSNGLKSVGGHIGIVTVAATGTNQGTAAPLTGGSLNNVTGSNGTKAVLLPTNVSTDNVLVYNNGSGTLPVFAAGTNTINGGSAGGSVTVEPFTLATFIALDGTNWAYDGVQNDQGPIVADSITGGAAPFPIVGLSAAQGGSVTITGGTSSTTGNAGGAATMTGGTPGATGVGGACTITSGPGGTTSGAAGAVTISVGACTNGVGAGITITAGNGATGTNGGGSINMVPGTAVSTGVPGEVQVNGNSQLNFTSEVLTATDATRTLMVATRPLRVKAASVVWTTGSTSGTLQLEKCTGTTAPGSGTALLTGTVSLSGTGNTVASGTLVATVASITFAAGDRLGIVIAGTMTNLVGCRLTVALTPV